MQKFLIFFFSVLIQNVWCQSYEFYGIIKLNGLQEAAISYRLVFTEKNGIIKGHTITDMTGEHETKNLIEGTYNAKTKVLTFRELDIVYTKSFVSESSFCFVNYSGKIKLSSSKATLDGDFKGLFQNKTKCIDGTLTLVNSNMVDKILAKATKKINKSKKLSAEQKEKYNPNEVFDSMTMNQLMNAQNMSVFNNSEKIFLKIWDRGIEDGDMINLYHNNQLILKNYLVTKAPKRIEVILQPNSNVFRIEAINEGTDAPNTAMMELEGDKKLEFQSNLKKGETTSITIIKK